MESVLALFMMPVPLVGQSVELPVGLESACNVPRKNGARGMKTGRNEGETRCGLVERGGQDDVVSAEDLAEMVANGELRYVLYGGDRGNKEDIANWLASSCSVVSEFSNQSNGQNQAQGPDGGGPNQASTLYMCK